MAKGEKEILTYINFEPTHARSAELRPKLEEEIKGELIRNVPAMVSRIAELEPLITQEIAEYADFLMESERAFAYGLWRGVIALIGITAESFIGNLYNQITKVRSPTGEEISKEKLFGTDDRVSKQRKLDVLRLFGLINKKSYDKLVRINKLRDLYVHPKSKAQNPEQDAREVIKLFRALLKERFDTKYTIKEGKIVERQADTPDTRPAY